MLYLYIISQLYHIIVIYHITVLSYYSYDILITLFYFELYIQLFISYDSYICYMSYYKLSVIGDSCGLKGKFNVTFNVIIKNNYKHIFIQTERNICLAKIEINRLIKIY